MRKFALHLGVMTVVSLALVPSTVTGHEVQAQASFFDDVLADRAQGQISTEEALLEAFRFAFAPQKVSARYARDREPIRCMTPWVAEYYHNRDHLSTSALAEIEGYLNPPQSRAAAAVHISPSGRFEFTYETTGSNAVDATDTSPANGIPDYVERCAEYADESWNVSIDTIGFVPPILTGGTYKMSFQALGAGFYGFASVDGATTRIVLHNTFAGAGWPGPNDDPDGDPLGRAKVTIAHEFKHASQFNTSNWTEGSWLELDAMWIEDRTFDFVNDYHNWIDNGSLSQLDSPGTSLDNGGGGNYEDLLWETYLSSVFGDQIIVDYWVERDVNGGTNIKGSYQAAMALYGTSWDESWPRMYEYAWFTGSRAEPPFGFPDAADLYRMELTESINTYPSSTGGSIPQLAAHPRRYNQGNASGAPRIVFDGDDSIPANNWTVSIILEEPDGTFTITRPTIGAGNSFDFTSPMPWSSLSYMGVIVTNSRRNSAAVPYTLDVTDAATTDVNVAAAGIGRLTMQPARPNPFRSSTAVSFSVPAATSGSVQIFDVSGRSVRTLHRGDLAAGPHSLTWDGRNDQGRPLPASIYWAKIDTERESVSRKITLIR